MPWENRNGGRGPWGQGPTGPGRGGPQPPDLEELLRRSQDRLRQALPSGSFGAGGIALALFILVALWLASGFYWVDERQVGVVMRFGQFSKLTQPGLNYHLPWPVETVETPTLVRQFEYIGYRPEGVETGQTGRERDVPEESLMLTGDENIIEIDFSVAWRVRDAVDYLFNVQDPGTAIKAVAESAMREVVGSSKLFDILGREGVDGAEGNAEATRPKLIRQVQQIMQAALDSYGAGILIEEVQFQRVDPPQQVLAAFRDVQAARAEAERKRNEARAYENKIIPEAQGEAERIKQAAQAYWRQVINESRGEADRFRALYEEYRRSPAVTRERLFIETMERVLGPMNKIILDEKGAGSGVVPYLPLDQLRNTPKPGTSTTGGN